VSRPRDGDLARFEDALGEGLGLLCDGTNRDLVGETLEDRLRDTRLDVDAYLARLRSPDTARPELAVLARALTVGETYFFRGRDHFGALAERVLPERARARSPGRPLRLLSAGCASGEEPYTLAMVAIEALGDAAWPIAIDGLDVNPAVLERARAGRYSEWSLRETPADVRARWFANQGREWVLAEEIRRLVRFTEGNLLEDHPLLLQGGYDVILCRNVLIYFTPQALIALVERLARALAPGGYLFLGHAETLRGISRSFHLISTHDTFYYRVRDPGDEAPPELFLPPWPPSPRLAAEPPPAPVDEDWVGEIERSSQRILALAGQVGSKSAPSPRPRSSTSSRLEDAFELFRLERNSEALACLRALPPEAAATPDALLLLAVVLANHALFPEADAVCRSLLQADELHAGAHYVTALCREHAGDVAGALQCCHTAVYLDPAFAMPHLALGRIAKKRGDGGGAERELGRALALLAREDAARILLFGGGFSREGLAELCRAELAACPGKP
jgi:chemotaxis protein methyltransferase CheR